MTSERPRQVSVNEGIDKVVDTAQDFKNFLNSAVDALVDTGQDEKNEINKLFDQLVNELQKLKG